MIGPSLHISDTGLEARRIGGQAACIAAFFMSVCMVPSFGRPCGASSDAPVPIPGLPTRTACPPDLEVGKAENITA
jgi:hypothetical protein